MSELDQKRSLRPRNITSGLPRSTDIIRRSPACRFEATTGRRCENTSVICADYPCTKAHGTKLRPNDKSETRDCVPVSLLTRCCCQKSQIAVAAPPRPSTAPRVSSQFYVCVAASAPAFLVWIVVAARHRMVAVVQMPPVPAPWPRCRRPLPGAGRWHPCSRSAQE